MIELVFLTLAFVCAAFVLPSRRVAGLAALEPRALLKHLLWLGLVYILACAPCLTKVGVMLVLVMVVVHAILDVAVAKLHRRWPTHDLWIFLGRLAVSAVAIVLVADAMGPAKPSQYLSADLIRMLYAPAANLSVWLLAACGGRTLVQLVLEWARIVDEESPVRRDPSLGGIIGVLERLLTVTMIAVGAWGAAGLIFAAKSLARFKEFDDRKFSEYYLIGTLSSLLVAVVCGLLLKTFLSVANGGIAS